MGYPSNLVKKISIDFLVERNEEKCYNKSNYTLLAPWFYRRRIEVFLWQIYNKRR